ncbi:MAG: tetraacyldisaccharide 4'-kinase [Bacteroidales bacterium]
MGYRKYFILYPFSLLYRLITDIRNFLYDTGFLSSREFDIPVICVGNITMGGTGKTPHTEYLIDLLRRKYRVAVLSRGYKRESHGFRLASASSTASDIGDEPLQIFQKFPEILVAVDGDRVNGVSKLIKDHPETEIIVMDDGFQHRSIKPGLSILLTDYGRLITRDHLIPYGRLRESAKNSMRAGIIIVTKSAEDIAETEIKDISTELRLYSEQNLFFTTVLYKDPVPLFEDSSSRKLIMSDEDRHSRGAVLITGISSPQPFLRYLSRYFSEIDHIDLPDHHCFNERDIKVINDSWNNLKSSSKYIITTEKDAVRLREFANITNSLNGSIYYIPVSVNFLNNGKYSFDNLIFDYVGKNKGNS